MSGILEFGPFRLDTATGVVSRDGNPAALGPRAVAVLRALIEHANEFVSKAELIDAAWRDLVVEEANLAVQVSAIRRVLGRDRIETLARRGYRFVGRVNELDDERQGVRHGRRSNLPAPLTSFVGRDRELAEIGQLLPGSRLITLVGMGGIGKTRLALRTAADVADRFGDGAWFVDLAPIADAALVPSATAEALGIREMTGKPVVDTLCAQLARKQLLLILDNCEHLVTACARLVDALLEEAPGLAVIATSREPLGVAGEQIYTLQPLALPADAATLETMRRSDAVRLFVERVQLHVPDFELTTERAQAIADVCIHLDGIPLALELAAARARSLSVEQINARLGDRFRLLTGGSRLATPRQQTLRATLDWSYDLLVEDERVALRRLAVFPGSFTAEAASAVVGDARIDEFAVIDILSRLVARSLVIADTNARGTRYRLLETTRQYAAELLAEAGETDIVRHRHAEYLQALFERAPDHWLQWSDVEFRAVYLPELAHVRAALEWAFGSNGQAVIGIPLAAASGALWMALGLRGEGARWTKTAIGRITPETPEAVQAAAWFSLGRIVDEDPSYARPALERAADLYRRLGDNQGLGLSLSRLGRVLASLGRFEQSEAALVQAGCLLEPLGPELFSLNLFNCGSLKSMAGDSLGARKYYERSLELFRTLGRESDVHAALGNIANAAWAAGDFDAAASSFRQQVTLVRSSPERIDRTFGWVLMSLAGALTEQGELDEALVVAREGLPLVEEDGTVWRFIDSVALRAGLAGRLFDAARLAGYADATFVAKAAARHPIDVRHRTRLHEVLREKLQGADLERLLGEGAKLSDADACRLALVA